MEAVDAVALLQPDHPKGPAHRAAARGPEMIAEAPWQELPPLALRALINCHIVEALEKRSVDPPKLSTALSAFNHYLTIVYLASVAETRSLTVAAPIRSHPSHDRKGVLAFRHACYSAICARGTRRATIRGPPHPPV